MVGPSRGSEKNYQCPLCGREASEQNRYCSECFLVNPTQPGKPSTISLVMNGANNPGPVFTLQLVAVIAVGLLLVLGGLWAWNKLHPEVPPGGEDIPFNQPAGEMPGGKTPPPVYPGGTTTRFETPAPADPGQTESELEDKETGLPAQNYPGIPGEGASNEPGMTQDEAKMKGKTDRSGATLQPPAPDGNNPGDNTTVKGRASQIPPQDAGKADQDLPKTGIAGEQQTDTGKSSDIR